MTRSSHVAPNSRRRPTNVPSVSHSQAMLSPSSSRRWWYHGRAANAGVHVRSNSSIGSGPRHFTHRRRDATARRAIAP
jgi:hypothetical protein